jgi:hypothetical protein
VLSRVRPSSAAGLPAPGSAAAEILLLDLALQPARRAVVTTVGIGVLEHFQKRNARWAAVVLGHERIVAIPLQHDSDLVEIAAHACELTAGHLPLGPIVLLPFTSPEVRQRVIDAARLKELETAEMKGAA